MANELPWFEDISEVARDLEAQIAGGDITVHQALMQAYLAGVRGAVAMQTKVLQEAMVQGKKVDK